MAAVEALPPLREVIREAGLDARRSLGQNFLLDLNLTGRIARTAAPLDGVVVEIGPGPGGLTRALLLAGAEKVIAIEKDSRAIAALAPLVKAAQGRLEIIESDALEVDISRLAPKGTRCQIVANLPYNIATTLLLNWFDAVDCLAAMTLMFQREVGQRITAPPGTSAYGRLSVISQWLCETTMLFDIPPRAFVPPPKVTSSVVRLIPRAQPLAEAEKARLEDVTRVLFGQRRKMLRASAKAIGGQALLDAAGIDGQSRPEKLSVEDFCALAEALRLQPDQ
ncbi:MAG: 16S rRNA (adenine(1518)-N(6)/adenine(1519)-N(6))-dimethyltransferase RsmA [Candidatus Puniceispirillales bacterium]